MSSGCRGLVWSGLGRACGQRKSMFLDDTVEAKKTACGSIAHAGRCRPLSLEPCCAGAVGVFVCAQASALTRQGDLRRLAQGFQQGAALSLQFVHLCHGCLPMAPQGFRCTARQSCCALPTPGDSHRQEVPTTPQGREPTALQRSRAFPSASPGAVAPPCRCPLAAERPCVVRAWAYLRPTQEYVSR